MQTKIVLLAAMVACACARDLRWEKPVGGGTLWGNLGTRDLTGSAGYKGNIFDNSRGVLDGQAYGQRDLLSDSSSLGGGLNWRNPQDTIRAKLDVNKEIGGRTGATLMGERAWKLDKDSHFVVGAGVSKTEGRQAEGQIQAGISKDW